ncbi:glycosyltransferase family 4 protein [Gracilibacillus kekensis]|uniref:UDP-GlcNAc:undecaprenyl-phosphate GlcNAc-1-phosphate transferase n=1 Tax=Gracilibacillus kekensis TaxID=1027249 RepID=A0A1M7K6Y0_9BACI|nr:MraY family glycosyltransferase [Gracilibacillus kekensis]SHM60733.1 UDP-GlcNAc:undecaprenyl-phosphate GlcNAc-1-phosphate transferase [Gracilibacillus kekensis]
MYNILELVIAFVLSAVVAFATTPIVKKLAIKINAIDLPDERKKHERIRARLGGIAIILGVVAGLLYIQPQHPYMLAIILGGLVIIVTGIIDDLISLKAYQKLIGQLIASVIVMSSGLLIDAITIPFIGPVELHGFSYPLTILWIVGVSNSINLIDGLDGLAAGVSAIGLTSILIMAIMDYQLLVVYLCIIMIGSCLGFLYHNFYPAKIFMGDTGALFLGYAIAVISMLGLFKNVALFSFIIPIIVIAVPIFDTLFAILRRLINKQNIGAPDRKHIHYQLMDIGYSHQTAVLIIYAFSGFFGIMAIIFSSTTMLVSLVIFGLILLGIQIIAELSGVVLNGQKPVLSSIQRLLTRK